MLGVSLPAVARTCHRMRSRGEIECQKELEAAGYVVDFKMRPGGVRRGYATDILGAFDVVAYRPGELRFVSVKAVRHGLRKEHRELVAGFELPEGCTKEVWLYDPKGQVRRKEKL